MKQIPTLITLLLLTVNTLSQTTIAELKQLRDEGKYKVALDKANILVKTDSLNANLWNELGELQILNKRYNDAVISFKHVLKLDSTGTKAYFSLANSYLKSGRTGAAVTTYKLLLTKDNNNIAALSKLAQIYFSNRPNLAYIQYEKLYNLDTLNTHYLFMMAKCLLAYREAIKAFELLKKAFAIDSSNINVAVYLNKMYSGINNYDTAMIVINKVIEQFPDEGHLYFRRGSTQFTKNYHFRSIPDFKKAMELNYKTDVLINRLAKSLFATKKYKASRDYFNELLRRQDTIDYQVCMYMGNIYNEFNKPDSALFFLNKAIELITPDDIVMSSISGSKSKSYKLKKDYTKQIEFIKKRQEYMNQRGFRMYFYLLEVAKIYDEDLNNKKAALHYYTEYYNKMKDKALLRGKHKEQLIARINQLKEDLHFANK